MTPAQQADIAHFTGQDAPYFAKWLRLGFERWLFGEPERYVGIGEGQRLIPPLPRFSAFAFPFATLFIEADGPISEHLGAVFDALKHAEQDAFQAGLEQALRRLRLDQDTDLAIGLELLLLAARIKAVGVIGQLAQRVSEIGEGELAERFFLTAFNLVRRLAKDQQAEADRSDAADFVRQVEFVRGPLSAGLARVALTALAAAEPKRLHDHLRRLYVALEADLGRAREARSAPDVQGRIQAARRRLILDVANVVPFQETLRATADNGRFRPDGVAATQVPIDWWSYTLLGDTDARMERLRSHLGLPQPVPPTVLEPEHPDPCEGEDEEINLADEQPADGPPDDGAVADSDAFADDDAISDDDYRAIRAYIPIDEPKTAWESAET